MFSGAAHHWAFKTLYKVSVRPVVLVPSNMWDSFRRNRVTFSNRLCDSTSQSSKISCISLPPYSSSQCVARSMMRPKMRTLSIVLVVAVLCRACTCDVQFTSPQAGDTLSGGVPFNVSWIDSGVVPLLSDYDNTYWIGLFTGNDSHPVRKSI